MRLGLQGPSVLSFTDGGAPNNALFARKADWSWFDSLGVSKPPHFYYYLLLFVLFWFLRA